MNTSRTFPYIVKSTYSVRIPFDNHSKDKNSARFTLSATTYGSRLEAENSARMFCQKIWAEIIFPQIDFYMEMLTMNE